MPGLYASGPGAYIRWKLRTKIGKELSAARGENQHRRSGPPAPEYLSKTGETGGPGGLPEVAEASTAEGSMDRALRFKHLERLCESSHELAVIRAIEVGRGDEDATVAMLSEAQACSPEQARKSVNDVVKSWSQQLGEVPRRAA